MSQLLGLQGSKVTRTRVTVMPSGDRAVADALMLRGLLGSDSKGFYATVQGLSAVEHMVGKLTSGQIG